MIRLSNPAYEWVSKHLPDKWLSLVEHYALRSHTTVNQENNWKKFLKAILRILFIYGIVTVAAIVICIQFVYPFLSAWLPDKWSEFVGLVITVLAISPFLRAIMAKKNHSVEFQALWRDNRFNRAPLVSIILLRVFVAIGFVMYVISCFYQASVALAGGIALVLVLLMIYSRRLKRQSIFIERTFMQNLNVRERYEEYRGEKAPEYAGHLLSHDMHLSDFDVPADSLWAGQTLKELNVGKIYGVHVVSILRGSGRVNIPGGNERIYPNDRLQVIGTDEQLSAFTKAMDEMKASRQTQPDWEQQEICLKQFIVDENTGFMGKSIRESGIRSEHNCLIVGIEKNDGTLMSPVADEVLEKGEVVWVVGEENDVAHLLDGTKEKNA